MPETTTPMTADQRRARINELNSSINTSRSEIRRLESIDFEEQAQELFARIPEIEEFSWTQYTPYFNDGDECVFSVDTDARRVKFTGGACIRPDEIYIRTNKWDSTTRTSIDLPISEVQKQIENYELEDCDTDETIKLVDLPASYDRIREISRDISNFLSSYSDSYMKSTFGDHTQVTLNRNTGTSTDEYSHD